MKEVTVTPTWAGDDREALQLGQVLGRRQAFVVMAGRCSADDADCIKRLRDDKLYLKLAPNWGEFCPKYLGMSKASADRVIRWLEQFGPDYFTLAQLTRVNPEEYRELVAPVVSDGAIRIGGEAIALIPENAERVAAAVGELRHAAAPESEAEPATDARVTALSRRLDGALKEFEKLRKSGGNRQSLMALAQYAQNRIQHLEEACSRP